MARKNSNFSYVIDVSAEIGKAKKNLDALVNQMSSINFKPKFKESLDKEIRAVKRSLEDLGDGKITLTSDSDINKAQSLIRKVTRTYSDAIDSIYSKLKNEGADLTNILELQANSAAKKVSEAFDKYAKNSKNLNQKNRKNLIKKQEKLNAAEAKYKAEAQKKEESELVYKNLNKELSKTEKHYSELKTKLEELNAAAPKTKSGAVDKRSGAYKEITALEKDISEAKGKYDKTKTELDSVTTVATKANFAQEVEKARKEVDSLNKEIKDIEIQNFNELKKSLKEVIPEAENLEYSLENLEKLEQLSLAKVSNELTDLREDVNKLDSSIDKVKAAGDEMEEGLRENFNKASDLKDFDDEIERTKQKLKELFSIGTTVELFRRTISNAKETVKDLDAAMTQTAVVTDFSVGDMWDQLPEYTKRANALGTTIKGAYEAATLYYQQGLDTNEVIAVSNETLKMARIAGMEAAEATDMMTAALRGFNMEIDEASAKRINDVYSELAAITAADTEEIATAMTKTASIASSAGMEFETTAAFLSQIVETTREAPETAGTALKTVIARFQELKKDPSEIGEVDGEIVDANKIETALKTIDVALRDTNGQFRKLDDVFLEIAGKWDSLDTNTQRYIATIAAGSRQQSRFIAMMSDYERTMELVDAANNSTGASQKQFEKTTESLESKINKLKNAWDEFSMGIANSSLIKGAVDLLTNLLTVINKITSALGDGFIGSTFTLLTRSAGLLIPLIAGGKISASIFMKLGGIFGEAGGEAEFLGAKLIGLGKGLKKLSGEGKTVRGALGKVAGLITKLPPQAIAATVAIGALATVFAIIKKNSPEAKLAKLEENTTNAQKAAESSKKAYDDLVSSVDSIKNAEDTFKNLTIGTLEWKQALLESNSLILELLKKYPQLNKYLTTENIGGFTKYDIKEEGFDAILKEQQQKYIDAQNATRIAQILEAEGRLNTTYSEETKQTGRKANKIGGRRGGVPGSKADERNKANKKQISQEDLIAKTELEIQTQIGMEGIVSTSEKIEEETVEEISRFLTEIYDADKLEELVDEKEKLLVGSKESLQKTYTEIFGVEPAEELSKEQLKALIAEKQAAADIRKKAEEISNEVNGLGLKGLEEGFLAATGGVISQDQLQLFTNEQIKKLENASDWEEIADILDINQKKLEEFAEEYDLKINTFTGAFKGANWAKDNFGGKGLSEDVVNYLQGQYNSYTNKEGIDLTGLKYSELDALSEISFDDPNLKNAIVSAINEAETQKEDLKVEESGNYIKNYKVNEEVKTQNLLTETGISQEGFEVITKEIEDTIQVTEELADAGEEVKEQFFKDIARESIELGHDLKGLYDVFDENEEALAAKGTNDYAAALGKLKAQVQELTGANFTEQEISDNLELIKQAANGSIEAIEKLQSIAASKIIMDLDLPEEELLGLENQMEEFAAKEFAVGAVLNDEPFIQGLRNLVDAGKITQQNMEGILSNIGVEPQIEWVEKEMGFFGKLGNWLKGEGFKGTVKVPKITYRAIGSSATSRAANTVKNHVASKGGSNKGGSNKGGSDKDPWKNTLDKFYNTLEDINEELRIREELEREFAKISEDGIGNSEKLLQNLLDQEAALKRQEKLQQRLLEGKKAEMQQYLKDKASFGGYATYNWSDNTIEINWDAINKVTDADKGKEIEEYISGLEELQDSMDGAVDSLADIEKDLKEINERGKQEYGKLEEQILEAYVSSLEKEIDELDRVYTAIDDANSELINILQTNLDKFRQDRENKDTEEEISETERRLAYLRQDTSGANALEILQLEKDLEEQKENYTDTLIDQKINELERQNEIAAQQRERQIELAREQVNWSKEQGMYWDEVEQLLKSGITNNGVLIENSQLQKLLQDNQGYGAMSQFQKESWNKDMANMIELADAWKKKNTGVGLNGNKTTTTSSSSGGTSTKSNPVTSQNTSGSGNYGSSSGGGGSSSSSSSSSANNRARKANVEKLQKILSMIYSANLTADGIYGPATKNAVKEMQKHLNGLKAYKHLKNKPRLKEDGIFGSKTAEVLNGYLKNISSNYYKKSKISRLMATGILQAGLPDPSKTYKKGGIADFTGPAWLDGTKSHPELVLNAQDTKNFIQLKNVLSDLMSDNISDGNGGDNYYEIHIEVDEIANDYDVEKLASKVKKIIANDSMYRNVNAINMLR